MILQNKHRKLEAALLALGAPAAMATTASADTANGAVLTAPNAVTLQPGTTTSLGKAMASGIPEDATGAKITSDADAVLKVVGGKVTAPAGTYTVTWTLSYTEKGKTVTKTATQKVTVVKAASAASSAASSANSKASSTASSAVSNAESKASSAESNASSAESNASSAASDADEHAGEYTTVTVDPDDFLTKYLEAATAKGVTGTINAHITGGMKKDATGNPVSTVSVDENGKITVTDADKSKLAGTMTTTLSNGNVLTSVIDGGAMTTAVTTGDNILNPASSAASDVSSAASDASSASSDVSSSAVLEPVSSAASNASDLSSVASGASSAATIDNVDPAVSSAAPKASDVSSTASKASSAASKASNASSAASKASSAASKALTPANATTAAAGTGGSSAKTLPQTGEDQDSYVLAALGVLDTVFLAGIAANIKKRKTEE